MSADTERFRELYDAHFDAVARYAQSRADPDTAKDATAQTFLVAWRRREDLLAARHPLGWLLGATRRTLADQRRAAARQSRLRDRVGGEHAAVPPLPRDPAVIVTERDAVAAAFSALRDADREVLALIAWDALSGEEAAAVLGCSPAAFAVRLHRARGRFRAELTRRGADQVPQRPRTADLADRH